MLLIFCKVHYINLLTIQLILCPQFHLHTNIGCRARAYQKMISECAKISSKSDNAGAVNWVGAKIKMGKLRVTWSERPAKRDWKLFVLTASRRAYSLRLRAPWTLKAAKPEVFPLSLLILLFQWNFEVKF